MKHQHDTIIGIVVGLLAVTALFMHFPALERGCVRLGRITLWLLLWAIVLVMLARLIQIVWLTSGYALQLLVHAHL